MPAARDLSPRRPRAYGLRAGRETPRPWFAGCRSTDGLPFSERAVSGNLWRAATSPECRRAAMCLHLTQDPGRLFPTIWTQLREAAALTRISHRLDPPARGGAASRRTGSAEITRERKSRVRRCVCDAAGLVWRREDDGVDTRCRRRSVGHQVAKGSGRWLCYVEKPLASTLAST